MTSPGGPRRNRLARARRERESCDTTGTETNGGYTEARFNFDVAIRLAADLRREGARVILTRRSNSGIGPCVDERSRIIDRAHANVAIDIHADGGPAWGRGFAILEPVADGINDRVIGRSMRLGRDVLRRFRRGAGMPLTNYDGGKGLPRRSGLAGLTPTSVPQVHSAGGRWALPGHGGRARGGRTDPRMPRRQCAVVTTVMREAPVVRPAPMQRPQRRAAATAATTDATTRAAPIGAFWP